jgi:rubredoxin
VIVMAGKKDDWDCRYGPYVYRPRNATPHNGTPHDDPFSDPPQKH